MKNRQPQSVWTATAEVEFLLVLCSCSTLEWPGKERLGKVQTGTVRYGESVWVTCTIGSSPCHLLFRFSRAQLHFAVSLIGLGNRLARPAKAPSRAQPKSALLNQRSPHHPPTTRPENPSCRRLLTERLPVPQNGTPLRPHRDPISKSRIGFILRIRVSFSLPLGLLIICHHRPRPRGGLARPNPLSGSLLRRHRLGRVESRAPGRRNSLLARVAQLARLSTTDRVSATTLAAASAIPAASAAARARLLT